MEGFVFFELVAQVNPTHAVGVLGEEFEDAVVGFGSGCHGVIVACFSCTGYAIRHSLLSKSLLTVLAKM